MKGPISSNLLVGAAVTFAVGAGILALVAANSGYDSRRRVSEAFDEAAPLKQRVSDFFDRTHALPGAADAAVLRKDQRLKRARSVEWDVDGRRVVVTMDGEPYPGKRFGFVAEAREGRLEWACRRIDIEAKYMPAACR